MVVLFLSGMVAVLATVVGQQVLANSNNTAISVDQKEAAYTAQAALNLALADLNAHRTDANYASPPVTLSGSLPGQSQLHYQVSLENNRDGHLSDIPRGAVRVRSSVSGLARGLRIAPLEATAFRFQPNYDRALLANRIELSGNTRVAGKTVSVDNITISDQAQVQGDFCYRRGVQGTDGTWVVPSGLPAGWIGGTRQALQQGTHFTGQLFAEATAPLQQAELPTDLAALPATESLSDFPPVPVMESRPVAAIWQPNSGGGAYDSRLYDEGEARPAPPRNVTSLTQLRNFNSGDQLGVANPFSGGYHIRAQIAQMRGVPVDTIPVGTGLGPIIDGVAYLSHEFDEQVQVGSQPPLLSPRGYANIHVPVGQTLRLNGRYRIAQSFQVDGTILLDGNTQIYVGQKVVISGQVNSTGNPNSLRVVFTDPNSTFEMHGGQASLLMAGAGLKATLDGGARLLGSLVANEALVHNATIDSSALSGQPVLSTELKSNWTFLGQRKI